MYYVLYDQATMSSISKNNTVAIKTIHLYPFQQKLYRTILHFLQVMTTKWPLRFLNILIILKNKSDHVGRCTVPENHVMTAKSSIYPNSVKGYTHLLHSHVSVIVILLVLWQPSRFLLYRPYLGALG